MKNTRARGHSNNFVTLMLLAGHICYIKYVGLSVYVFVVYIKAC